MLGLGLSLGDLAARRVHGGTAPPPSFTNVVIEGDSITSSVPDAYAGSQPTDAAGSFAYRWRATRPDLTVRIRAQATRVVGQAADLNDGGNSIMGHVAEDVGFEPDLIFAKIGANDMAAARTAAQYRADLTMLAGHYRSAGVAFAWSPPLPYNGNQGHPNYANFMAQRGTLLADCRDPAVHGQWCDHYVPLGEHWAFAATANGALYSDTVHLNAAGDGALLPNIAAALDTLADGGRRHATTMYPGRWPEDEVNLTPGETITRRIVVAGLAHAGIALTGDNAVAIGGAAGNPRLRLNGAGSYAAALAGWLYNGDTIEYQLDLSDEPATARTVTLQVGSDTRVLSYATAAAVTPASYAHGGVSIVNANVATHVHPLTIASDGLLVLGLVGRNPAPTAIGLFAPGETNGGIVASRAFTRGAYSQLDVWTVPVTAGTYDVRVDYAAAHDQTALSWGVAHDAQLLTSVHSQPGTDTGPFAVPGVTIPANGLALAFCAFDGGPAAVPYPVNSAAGTVAIDSGYGEANGERFGLSVGMRTVAGTGQSVTFGDAGHFANPPRGVIVLKAAGA